jgi:hypothetical protein
MNTTSSVFGETQEDPISSETVFDSASLKRGRGRPRKVQPEEEIVVKEPVDVGTLSQILNKNNTDSEKMYIFGIKQEIKVVTESKIVLFEEKVNTLLNSGWGLLGSPFNLNGMLAQALIRTTS